jgi:hypothetical protein
MKLKKSSVDVSNKHDLLPSLPERFIAKSGLEVIVDADRWVLLPNKGKGCSVDLAWLKNEQLSSDQQRMCLAVFIHYAQTKSASTVATVSYGVRPVISHGFPGEPDLAAQWSGLGTGIKKATNSFFCTLIKLGFFEFKKLHDFTTRSLDKSEIDPFNVARGRYSDLEFDLLCKDINIAVSKLKFPDKLDFNFIIYTNKNGDFNTIKNVVMSKMMMATLRRPLQVAMLKWSDIIPFGRSFNDDCIARGVEIVDLGSQSLQVRLFSIKNSNNNDGYRSRPEKCPMPLSDSMSSLIYKYKKMFVECIRLKLIGSCISFEESDLQSIIENMPVFPSIDIFQEDFVSLDNMRAIFTARSSLFHVSESSTARSASVYKAKSDRQNKAVKISSNRLRHTALTRAAEHGLDAALIARLTGVTEPAARHYIDMDYSSRRLIDVKYAANDFLRNAFNPPVERVDDGAKLILSNEFDAIGGLRDSGSCDGCLSKMGRPIGCYGCQNFRPLLEANHKAVLEFAEAKLKINQSHTFLSITSNRSVEKIKKQIEYIKMTIVICDDVIEKRAALDVK